MNPPDRSVVYRVSRNGHVMGEFDIDRIVELLDSGEFLWTDLCWAQGMAGWGPLTGLRPEIAAAKAFPPVAAVPVPLASARRRAQPPVPQASPSQASSSSVAGWGWVAGGVTLGAIIGLLITYLFPNVVMVDRPVDRIVEKPVEVVRTLEKRVEVPAMLSPSQIEAIDFARARNDANKREVGWAATSMIPVFDKKVRVVVRSLVAEDAVSVDTVRARVESVLRRNGFQVITEADTSEFAGTILIASLKCADPKDTDQISGQLSLTVMQYVSLSGGGIQKRAWVTTNDYDYTLHYGSLNFHKIPERFDDFAIRASNDLMKAGQLPYSK
jgi:hypothetical protein